MNLRTRAFGAPVLAVALALLGGTALSASFAQAADRIAPRANRGGFLGVRTQELTSDLRDSYDYRGDGVLVSGVNPDSPADRLGIREGDIITEVDGRSVDSPATLASRIRSRGAGTEVAITVWRDGRERSLGRIALTDMSNMGDDTPAPPPPPDMDDSPRAPGPPHTPDAPRQRIRIERRDRDDADKRDEADKDDDHGDDMGDLHELHGLEGLQGLQGLRGLGGMMALGRGRLGVELSDLDSDLGGYFHTRSGHGVLVTRVLEDTPAARAGLKAGDVIVEFDGKSVANGDGLRRLVNDSRGGDVEIRIERRGDERTLTAHLGDKGDWGGNMQFRSLPGGNGWGGNGKTRVYRYNMPGHGEMGREWQGLSDEDRAQLKKDMAQMRRDLARMKVEMREKMQKGDDDDRHDDGDRKKGDDDGDDDDDGN